MKKKMKKRFLTAVTTLLLTLSIGTTAFAAESANSPVPDTTQPAVTEAVVDSTEHTVIETVIEVTEDGNIRTVVPSLSEEFGSEDAEAFDINAQTRSASGYAADYTDYNNDSFTINVTGSGSLWGTAVMKAWSFSGDADISVTLYRPDGSVAFSDVDLPLNTDVSKSFANFPAGYYRLAYSVSGSYKGWIDCKLNG